MQPYQHPFPELLEFAVETRFPFFWLSVGSETPVPAGSIQNGIVTVAGAELKFKVPPTARTASLVVEVSKFEPRSRFDDYDDVVDVGLRCETGVLGVLDWGKAFVGEVSLPPASNGDFRLRYLVRCKPELSQVLASIQIWPGNQASPKIVKVGSRWGRFWAGPGRR